MPIVHFTAALQRFEPNLKSTEVTGNTVKEVVESIERTFPGLSGYLVEENGSLRKHVNIFINNSLITDKEHLSDAVNSTDELHVIQALSGG